MKKCNQCNKGLIRHEKYHQKENVTEVWHTFCDCEQGVNLRKGFLDKKRKVEANGL